MMKLKATNPLVLFVGALAIGLAGCADDVIITEPPPPPPPPPPESAEISIVSITEFDDGAELGELEDGPVANLISIVVNFDTGGFEAAALDVLVDSDVVGCQTFSGQASVGLGADVQTISCTLNTAQGVGACTGQTQVGQFENGPHTIGVSLTLQDGSAVTATRTAPLVFSNSNVVLIVPNDIGPRVVGLDEEGWWGGPRDLSWYACPVIFDSSLDDFGGVCEVTITASDGMLFTATSSSVTDTAEPYEATAQYRDVPTSDATWVDEDSRNEDLVEDEDVQVWASDVLACDGTNIDAFFSTFVDERNIDSSAPLCDDDPCEVWIDDDYPINDGNAPGFTNNVFSDGDFDLRDLFGTLVDDDGVGMVLGVTTVLSAWDYADGDQDNLVAFLSPVFGVGDLTEDDACGDDGTTDPALGAATFALGYGQCAALGEEGAPVDAYFIEIAEVGDLLGNALGDGTMDLQIEDEFITELDAPSGITGSGQLGADFTAPVVDELMPPDESPTFVWNPDLGVDYTAGSPAAIDLTRTCPSTDAVLDCESIMYEAADPDLASGDPGSGVEEIGCLMGYPNACDDANGDGAYIVVGIDDGPATCDGGAGCDAPPANLLVTDDVGVVGDDMFQAYFCDGPNVDAPNCDGTDDGTYTVWAEAADKAQVDNNWSAPTWSFILDTSPPVIGFGGITGLNSSNAATVQFVLDANVVDRNGDGTALELVNVFVSIEDVTGLADGDCTTLGDQLFDEASVLVSPNDNPAAVPLTVFVDVTAQVNANGGDITQTFTASNQSATLGLGDYTYCFLIEADDGAERKDGTDISATAGDINSVAGKDFTWQ